jgi:hypothetical protein
MLRQVIIVVEAAVFFAVVSRCFDTRIRRWLGEGT